MRDWSKFAWKKGDVLVSEDGSVHIIFEKFTDDTYTIFAGKHYYVKSGIAPYYERVCSNAITEVFTLEAEDAAKTYIRTIEERLDGKLNRETLEIEKPVFELGNLYVFNEQDEDGELTIIGKLIGKNESEDTLTFGNQYEIENEKFVTDQAFDLRISVHEELREATELEVELFNKHYAIWKKEKEAKEQRKRNREKYRAYQKEYWSKHYRNYGTKNRVADRAMRERKKPDVEKALSMFKNPQQAAHLAWLLENKKNNRS